MKFHRKKLSENGIALIFLIITILVVVLVIGILIKSIFDFKSIGATSEGQLLNEEAIRKIHRVYSR